MQSFLTAFFLFESIYKKNIETMIRINSIPLGLGNVFESRKMYYRNDPCDDYNPSIVDENLSLTNDIIPISGTPNLTCGPEIEPSRPGVAFCENTGNVYYFPVIHIQPPIEFLDPS